MNPTSFPRDKIKILLLEGIHRSAVRSFKRAGYRNVTSLRKALGRDELTRAIRDVHLLGIRSKTQVEAEVLSKAQRLLGVGCFCIGTNQVDLRAAAGQGVAVFNSPFSNTRSVAELVIGLVILLRRRIPEKNRALHQGTWLKEAKGSHEVRGKVLGIVGYGHIGSQVSVMAEAMGLKVLFYDIESKLPLGNAAVARSLRELLRSSDIVSLHVPATPETENLIDRGMLKGMKKGAILLNLSRGGVVDLEALAEALKSGHLDGAAIDVYPAEPKSKGSDFATPLQHLPNVILTPHIGGSTQEAQQSIGEDAAGKLIRFLETGATVGSHSLPALNLGVHENTHRILHMHKNVPGVLSEINSRLSKSGINILGQYLNTNTEVGYVVLDVDRKASKKAIEEVSKVPHTIRTRVLYLGK